MEIIPLIVLEKHEILKQDSEILEKLKNQNNEEKQKLYILDIYGVKKNKPNLTLYQKLSKNFDLWIDSGPRNLGDVVDVFMTGATSITLRRETWPLIDIENIREISENKIFQLIKHSEINSYIGRNIIPGVDGYVILDRVELITNNFKTDYHYQQFIAKNKTYIYENNIKKLKNLIERKINGVLVDLENYQRFKAYGF